MPAAALAARHKHLAGTAKGGRIRGGWFHLHRVLAVLGLLCAVAGLALIFARFRWAGRADTASFYAAHRGVGLAAVAAAVVQALLGALRPELSNTKRRPAWRRVHQAWGALTLLAGAVASYLGVALITLLSALPLAAFLAPTLAVSGLVFVVGLGLEARKISLERAGRYDKATHTLLRQGAATGGEGGIAGGDDKAATASSSSSKGG